MIHCKSCRQEKEAIEFKENSKNYKTCNVCRVSRRRSNIRLTIEDCKEFAEGKGGECLSEEYTNNKTKMNWKCSENHEWNTTFGNIKNQGQWCPTCAGNIILSLDECQQYAEEKGGECLSTEYKNNSTKMLWKCSENHEWNAKFCNIKNQGHWCPTCAGNIILSLDECKEFAEAKGGMCLSTEYKNCETKMLWKCDTGHEWESVFIHIKRGSWCPHCAGKAHLTLDECKEFAKKKGGKCLSEEYKNAHTKMLWKCDKGHEWITTFSSLKNGSRWCPQCSAGRSEQLCREIFEEHYGKKFPNRRPKWLGGLELDGYCRELGVGFEYNGRQHYEYNEHFHRGGVEEFKAQQERDRKKYSICAKKNISLILIPYKFNFRKPEQLKIFILDAISNLDGIANS